MVNSKLRRHKVMEKVIKKLMGNNLPPRFKFKDTYDSIEVPTTYQQYLPTQTQLEAEFDEMIAEEETMPTLDASTDDVKVLSSNLYIESNTGYVGIGTPDPSTMLDVMGDANVAALTATNIGLTHSLANRTTDTVFYSSDGNYIYKNTAAGLRTALDVPSASAAVFTGNVVVNDTTIQGTASTEGNFTSWTQNQKIVPNNPTSYDYFGQHSDISGNGNTIFVAARQEDTTASNSGAVYVYEYDGSSWTQTQMLKASDAGTSDTFGEAGVSLSRDGTVGIVGARGNDDVATDTGSAYIFRKGVNGTWSQDIKLSSDDQEAYDNFGLGVEISGDGNTAFIGEYRDDGINNALTDTGCVHIFKYINSSWVKQTVIRPSNAVASGYFGARISSSYDGTSIAVSNVGKNTSTGSAYIFNLINGTWTQEIELTASNGQANDEFTTELSMSNDGLTVCMGARYEDGATNSQSNSGAVYVFEKINGTWQEVAILRLNNPVADDNLGLRVDISGDGNFIVSGARNRENGSITNAGTVAVFSKTSGTWQFVTELFASDAASSDLFGDSAAISDDGEMILGGAVLEDYSGTDSGSAYVFKGTRTSTPASLNIDSTISVTGDINLTGNVGIGVTNPSAQLSIGEWNLGAPSGTTPNTQLLLSGKHNAGPNANGGYKLKIEGYDNDGGTVYPIYCKDENSNIDFYIKNRPSASGIPTMFFAGDLTVNGGITKTQYRPGEIIEEISSICDGSQIEAISGTYTIENVTGVQNGSTTHTAVTGSTISYTPPTGTKRVYYRFSYQWDCTENSGISHHQMQVDGTTLTDSRHTVASNYASTNWHQAIFPVFIEYTINCDASSTNAAAGKFTSWTSPKTLRVTYREYNGSYESRLHLNEWWDGSGTDRFVRPHLTIRAIA